MREEFGIAATSWKGFEFDGGGMVATRGRQVGELVKLLKGLKRRRFVDSTLGRPWTSFVPDVPAERVPEYFSDFGRTFGHDLCPVAWYFAQVEPDGEVTFCGDFPDYFIGNVRQSSFREIWTGEKAARFRAEARPRAAPHLRPLLRELRVREVGAAVRRPNSVGAGLVARSAGGRTERRRPQAPRPTAALEPHTAATTAARPRTGRS